jgi:hypothetical protein
MATHVFVGIDVCVSTGITETADKEGNGIVVDATHHSYIKENLLCASLW